MEDPAVRSSTTNIVTGITKDEHDLLVAIHGRSLTDNAMRCPTSTEAAPDIDEASELEQLLERRRPNF